MSIQKPAAAKPTAAAAAIDAALPTPEVQAPETAVATAPAPAVDHDALAALLSSPEGLAAALAALKATGKITTKSGTAEVRIIAARCGLEEHPNLGDIEVVEVRPKGAGWRVKILGTPSCKSRSVGAPDIVIPITGVRDGGPNAATRLEMEEIGLKAAVAFYAALATC